MALPPPIHMPQAVLFDVDGTLIDSNHLHAASWRDAFRRFGKEVSWERLQQHIGKGSDQYIPAFLSAGEVAEFGQALSAYKTEVYQRDYFPRAAAFPQVRELLQRIRSDGARIALATSAKPEELDGVVQKLDIASLIDLSTSAGDVDRSKPAPDIFAAAMEKLGKPPAQEVIVVGDTPYDAQAARKLGLSVVGLLCGGFSEEELRRNGCCAVYRDPADLLEHYDESPLSPERRRKDRRAA